VDRIVSPEQGKRFEKRPETIVMIAVKMRDENVKRRVAAKPEDFKDFLAMLTDVEQEDFLIKL
jgi:AmiR/NasT family two-component response regulator